MTLGALVNICTNISDDTVIMIYDSAEDFDISSCNWKSCKAESVKNSEINIDRLDFVSDRIVAVAIA